MGRVGGCLRGGPGALPGFVRAGVCLQSCLRFLLHHPPDPVIIASLILSVGQRAYLLCSLLFSQNLMHCSPSVNPCWITDGRLYRWDTERSSDWLGAVCCDCSFVGLISACGLLLFKLHCILSNYEMFYLLATYNWTFFTFDFFSIWDRIRRKQRTLVSAIVVV